MTTSKAGKDMEKLDYSYIIGRSVEWYTNSGK